METVSERLVREAAAKRTVLKLYQMDGWAVGIAGGDWYLQPDADGDSIKGMEVYELRNSPPELAVRVQVAAGTAPVVAVRMLRKMADWVETTPQVVEECPVEPEEEKAAKAVAALAGITTDTPGCVRVMRVIQGAKGGPGALDAWTDVDPRDIANGPVHLPRRPLDESRRSPSIYARTVACQLVRPVWRVVLW